MTTEYELVDLGVHYPDYFQGFGASFTSWNNATCGIGNTPREALDDCLEQVATSADPPEDIEALEADILGDYPAFTRDPQPQASDDPVDDTNDGPYWHIGIYW